MLCACDLSGRDYLGWAVDLPAAKVGDFDTELAKEFCLAFVGTVPAPSTSGKWPGRTPTTSWRRCSRAWAGR